MAQNERHARRLAKWVEAEGLPDDVRMLGPEHVAGFVADAEARRRDGGPRRPGSLNSLRSSLRGFLGYLERAGLVERGPARVLRMARVAPPAPRGMRSDDVAKLMAVVSSDKTVAARRDHALVAFLAGTGSHQWAALAMDLEDLELACGTATLREVQGGGTLEVYLRPELVEGLAAWLGDGRSGPVFAARDREALPPRQAQRLRNQKCNDIQ